MAIFVTLDGALYISFSMLQDGVQQLKSVRSEHVGSD